MVSYTHKIQTSNDYLDLQNTLIILFIMMFLLLYCKSDSGFCLITETLSGIVRMQPLSVTTQHPEASGASSKLTPMFGYALLAVIRDSARGWR